MAAHVLTIARQILSVIERNPERAVEYARGALAAPGTDEITYPCLRLAQHPTGAAATLGSDLYQALYMAAEGLVNDRGVGTYGVEPIPPDKRIPYIRAAAEAIVCQCGHLDNYPSLEAADDAWQRFVKPRKPYYRARRKTWDAWPWAANYPQAAIYWQGKRAPQIS